MLRSALAKSSPICGFAWIWLMPSIWYSIGSSTVMILTSGVLSLLSAVYSVVVLPEPVGPVTSTIPCGCSSTFWKRGMNCGPKPSLLEIQHHGLAIQQAHHHRFAVRRGNGAHAQVEFLALHPLHDPAVLRQAALGDVEFGHDLDAADHRRGQVGRRALALFQHAIDAVAHLQPIFERFDMDVGRAQFHCALDHQVHQPDHRRLRGQVAQVLDIVERPPRPRPCRRCPPSHCGPGHASARSARRSRNAAPPPGVRRARSPAARHPSHRCLADPPSARRPRRHRRRPPPRGTAS